MSSSITALSTEQLEAAKKSILFTASRPDLIMTRGTGMYLWDTNGKSYLDFVGGWAVTSLGHSPAVITEALERQSRLLVNASPSFYNTSQLKFAKLLTDISCFDRVFFASSGAEANEGAIKLARKYGSLYRQGANEIITMVNSFHGRTLATMSATGKEKWADLFEPKVPGFIHVALNDLPALRSAITEKTCAIMLEPIQGEGGVFAADLAYMKALRTLCNELDILLIFDEVQTGLGRTGKLFAYEYYGIEPDVMTLAKGIGGGFPLAALLAKEKFNVFAAGD
ncbi:MAG TPA: aminotransferase class III-fold pyridoxal phosphate-dependent enzyme, partial [Negativicutes bacterium]|nr:aminotransferase class III-fold pyridoxal phosphate-dependent enzyme [Negativicutes bacterium]